MDAKGSAVKITKVKAHCTPADVLHGIVSPEDFAGNAFADRFADDAAELAALPSAVLEAFDRLDELAWQVQARLTEVVCLGATREADKRDALLWKIKKAQRASEELANRAADLLSQPPPEPEFEPVAFISETHRLVAKRGIAWCFKCSSYATSRGRGVLKPCDNRKTPAGFKVLDRLRRGLIPTSKVQWPEPED